MLERISVDQNKKNRNKVWMKLLKELQEEANQIERKKKNLERQRNDARVWRANAQRQFRRLKRLCNTNNIEIPANLQSLNLP